MVHSGHRLTVFHSGHVAVVHPGHGAGTGAHGGVIHAGHRGVVPRRVSGCAVITGSSAVTSMGPTAGGAALLLRLAERFSALAGDGLFAAAGDDEQQQSDADRRSGSGFTDPMLHVELLWDDWSVANGWTTGIHA